MSESVERTAITISGVLALLAEGKSRKEIAEYYGKTQTEMQKVVWSHPKLKNRKAKKQYEGIELIDDVEDAPIAEVVEVSPVDSQITGAVTAEVAQVPGPEANQAFAQEEVVVEETQEETWK